MKRRSVRSMLHVLGCLFFLACAGSGSAPEEAPAIDLLGDGGSDASSGLGCSADLRSVLDANGKVVSTCPLEQGCAGGRCIDACTAAAASQGSLGCDFWVSTPLGYDARTGQAQPCFAMFVANAWPLAATVSVSRAG